MIHALYVSKKPKIASISLLSIVIHLLRIYKNVNLAYLKNYENPQKIFCIRNGKQSHGRCKAWIKNN